MTLLEIYKEKNENNEWFTTHSSLAKDAMGRMFEYTNTNYRTQKAFTDQFEKFLEIENKERDQWSRQEHHQQEVDKHRVVNMMQSKLFKKDVNGLYSRTTKGVLYSEFIELDLPEDDRKLLNYLFLLNGYYTNRKNYIIYRVKEDLLGYLLSTDGVTEDLLIDSAKTLLETDSLSTALRSHFFFLHSFYDDSDFLISYLRATDEEREELAEYIESNLDAENFVCTISKKYQPSGNFNHNMLTDEARVFLLTLLFIQTKEINISNIYDVFADNFNEHIAEIEKENVLKYLHDNKNVFDSIFVDVLELEEIEIAESDVAGVVDQPVELEERDIAEEYIDETSYEGKQRIKAVYNLRKRQARVQSGYTCALEVINNCKPVYFTAKVTGKNYLELHHLIPREFRNDFSYSIEVLANYVTLCPRCHRQIHLAVDRERKHLINALYEDRKDRLGVVGLGIERKNIYAYYKIDE